MVKSSRDYIKRKLEQSQTHCNYIFEHLHFILGKYDGKDYQDYRKGVEKMMDEVAILSKMLSGFREVC